MDICISKLTIMGSNNGLSPGGRQAIFWTVAGILLIGPLGTNFSEIWIEIRTFPFKKMHLKMLFGKWQPFCVLTNKQLETHVHTKHYSYWCPGEHQAISLHSAE